MIFANGRPRCRVFRWEGTPLELGRQELSEDDALDPLISRRHLSLRLDEGQWRVLDLGSRNGTCVANLPLAGEAVCQPGSTVRVGGAVLVPVADTLIFRRFGLGVRDGVVAGPTLRQALEEVAFTRKADIRALLLSGESGTGKEIAAKAFHEAGEDAKAPFVAVNCATIPKDLAERLLFGSRRGAFSGATDAPGHVQAAHGGTLFLDEVAELPLDVQTKLLRMLETREVLRLGATAYERVEVHVCAASWRDLRAEVSAGRFREDLYYRIGQPEVHLPPLRERLEEVPWHIQEVLEENVATRSLETTAAFVDACMARPWPGNVRELRAEVRRVGALAVVKGSPLSAEHLGTRAGMPIHSAGPTDEAGATPTYPDDEISIALRAEGGNVVGAARRLGVHRNKVRRWLERHGVDGRLFKFEKKT